MSSHAKIVLFGDQTSEPYTLIKELTQRSKHSSILSSFLKTATSVLKQELFRSQSPERHAFPSFHSILSLAEASRGCPCPSPSTATVLLCVAQLGVLIVEGVERIYETSNETSGVHTLGLCTGMLAAAAASVSRSTEHLLNLAPSIIRLALRLGLEASHRSRLIENSSDSWSVIVPDIPIASLRNLINEFNDDSDDITPTDKRIYISAIATTSATISGPPSTLNTFLSSCSLFQNVRKTFIPISAAFHAPHLGPASISQIVGDLSMYNGHRLNRGVCFVSTSSGTASTSSSLSELLCLAVNDILHEPLQLHSIMENLKENIRQNGSDVEIIDVGPVRVLNNFRKDLLHAGINVHPSPLEKRKERSKPLNSEDDIAVVGISARLPGGETLEEIWHTLRNGRRLHREVPGDRFSTSNTDHPFYGCFVDRPGSFDARLFNMSPREAFQTDPAQRLLLLTAYEALETAGYSPNGTPSYASERIGTFFGQTVDQRSENVEDVDIFYVPGNIRSFGPGRLNFHFGWEGPSYCIDAACSSSAVAVQLAASSLRSGECDTAVAGGTNILIGHDMYEGLNKGGFLSRTGACETFDDYADGYCRADGVGTIVLKRFKDAVAEGDNIYAVIKAAGTNHSTRASSITQPDSKAQENLFRHVLQEAGIETHQVDYAEMHGTGTQAGDNAEFASVVNVLCHGRHKSNPLHIGAVKANIGHAEAAAGLASLIKVVLMFRHNTIPPHVGISTRLNSSFQVSDDLPISINKEAVPFQAGANPDKLRRVLINNFNASGGNTCILIEEPPPRCIQGTDHRTNHVITLSAKTATALRGNIQRLLNYVQEQRESSISDIAYSTTARRLHHNFRRAIVSSSAEELSNALRLVLRDECPKECTKIPAVIFVFSGQGSQYAGMCSQLYQTCSQFRSSINEMNDISTRQGFPSFRKVFVCSSDDTQTISSAQAQLALVASELALAYLWQSWGLTPSAVIGHSIGEYAALCFAGVLSVSDALYLTGKRATSMDQRCESSTHTMLAIQADARTVQITLAQVQGCTIACFNSSESTIVSGECDQLHKLIKVFAKRGVASKLLPVPFAFHSVQMKDVCSDIRTAARNAKFHKPRIPVASTLLGSMVTDEGTFMAEYLSRQTREPVMFQRAVEACQLAGLATEHTIWMEVGPHPVCQPLIGSILRSPAKLHLSSIRRKTDCWRTLSQGLAIAYESGVDVKWNQFHKEFLGSLSLVELPSYAFDLKDYWHSPKQNRRKRERKHASGTMVPIPHRAFPTVANHIVNESVNNSTSLVTFSVKLADEKLNEAILGHVVENAALCPGSVLADLALQAAHYLSSQLLGTQGFPAMDILQMEMFNPLVMDVNNDNREMRIEASCKSLDSIVDVQISSYDGLHLHKHARCAIEISSPRTWRQRWDENSRIAVSRIERLKAEEETDDIVSMPKKVVYKLFDSVVRYSKDYQAIDRIKMDCTSKEAEAKIKFQRSSADSNHSNGPYYLDVFIHLAGFVLNGDLNKADDIVYICQGWNHFQISGPISHQKTYNAYVHMQATEKHGIASGNVQVFDNNELVVNIEGLRFRAMKRKVLQALLSSPTANETIGKGQKASSATRKAMDGKTQFGKFLAIAADETGLHPSEFTEATEFAEVGVDSLLTVSIMGKLRDSTGFDLPARLLNDYPTVAKLKRYFINEWGNDDKSPASVSISKSSITNDEGESSTGRSTPATSDLPSESETKFKSKTETLRDLLASELGVELSTIDGKTNFADIGVDSILSILILTAFKRETGEDLDANFLQQHPTLADVKKTFGELWLSSGVGYCKNIEKKPSYPGEPVPVDNCDGPDQAPIQSNVEQGHLSLLLQGSRNCARTPLFLLPDGSGSLFSYIHLPRLHQDGPVWGIDSPFHRNPEAYDLSFEQVSSIFVQEMRRIQPRGPYRLGGWSLGGIHAFEAARQLLALGEQVEHLVLIDSPCPGTLPPLPSPTLELLEQAGVFQGLNSTGGEVPAHTKAHFLSSVRALSNWSCEPLNPSEASLLGRVTAIWARDGVFDSADDDAAVSQDVCADCDAPPTSKPDVHAKQWLTARRANLGPNGWDELTRSKVSCLSTPGNHFSMMFPPNASRLGEQLAKVL